MLPGKSNLFLAVLILIAFGCGPTRHHHGYGFPALFKIKRENAGNHSRSSANPSKMIQAKPVLEDTFDGPVVNHSNVLHLENPVTLLTPATVEHTINNKVLSLTDARLERPKPIPAYEEPFENVAPVLWSDIVAVALFSMAIISAAVALLLIVSPLVFEILLGIAISGVWGGEIFMLVSAWKLKRMKASGSAMHKLAIIMHVTIGLSLAVGFCWSILWVFGLV